MSLHVEIHGSGAPLLLIHGWGMHGGIWSHIIPQLAQHFRVHCVDLPGHGHSKAEKGEGGREKGKTSAPPLPFTLDVIVEKLSAQFEEPLFVCGWSLGGQIALHWAQIEPQKIRKLVLIASTPCFTERDNWLFGMTMETLQQFTTELERDHAATLRRFLSLQMRGSTNERELLMNLRSHLFNRGEPDILALRGGLRILCDTDLRKELASIRQPVLLVTGERDKLTPSEASFYMAQTLPDARVVEIPGAAHAPFLSHPEIFVGAVINFMNQERPSATDNH